MKSKLNFLSRVRIASSGIKSYSVFIKDSFSKALGYALMLSILVGAILGVSQFALFSFLEKGTQEIVQNEEFKFKFENGILNFENSPYEADESNAIVILDTNKSLEDKENLRSTIVHKDMAVVILKDGIIARTYGEGYEIKYTDIPLMPSFVDNNSIINAIDKLSPIKYLVFVISIFVTYVKILAYSLVVSIGGLIVSKLQGLGIKYRDILKLSVYSLTAPILLQLILPIGFLVVIIASIYLFVSMTYIKIEETKTSL